MIVLFRPNRMGPQTQTFGPPILSNSLKELSDPVSDDRQGDRLAGVERLQAGATPREGSRRTVVEGQARVGSVARGTRRKPHASSFSQPLPLDDRAEPLSRGIGSAGGGSGKST